MNKEYTIFEALLIEAEYESRNIITSSVWKS